MSDKERLEEVKEAYRWAIDNSLVPRLSDSDTEWLIEQAERVHELEEGVKEAVSDIENISPHEAKKTLTDLIKNREGET